MQTTLTLTYTVFADAYPESDECNTIRDLLLKRSEDIDQGLWLVKMTLDILFWNRTGLEFGSNTQGLKILGWKLTRSRYEQELEEYEYRGIVTFTLPQEIDVEKFTLAVEEWTEEEWGASGLGYGVSA